MALALNADLEIPYEIGRYIAFQVPYLDNFHGLDGPWAEHKRHFEIGPNPCFHQMKQGLILKVSNSSKCPGSLYTRYGEWTILGSCFGSFEKVFEVVRNALNLKIIEELSTGYTSYWAVQSWQGQLLAEPIQADERNGEFIPYKEAMAVYEKFKKGSQ